MFSQDGRGTGVADPGIDRAVRTAELDGLRAVAVTLVFVYHACLQAVPLQRYLMPGAFYFEAGVEVFFVLSGFLIYSPFARAHLAGRRRPRLADYLRRRALRIYPAYWVAVGVLMALGWVVVDDLGRLVSELTLTQGYRPVEVMGDQGLQPAWTLCVEVTFYAFVPLWARLVRLPARRLGTLRAELAGALLLVAVGVVSLTWATFGTIPILLGVLLPNLPTLGAGMLLAVVAAARPSAPRLDGLARRVPPALVCWPLAFAALLWMPGRPTTWNAPDGQWFVADLTQNLFGLLLTVPVMLGAAGVVGRVLRLGPVTWVGLVSYGVYLWHYDLLYELWPEAWQAGRVRAGAAALGIFALAVACGAASHYLIERPAQACARRFERRRKLVLTVSDDGGQASGALRQLGGSGGGEGQAEPVGVAGRHGEGGAGHEGHAGVEGGAQEGRGVDGLAAGAAVTGFE